jgi:triacylglycerol lipase
MVSLILVLMGCSGSGLTNNAQFADNSNTRDCATHERGAEGDFTWIGTWGDRQPCAGVAHAIGGAQGTTLRVRLSYWSGGSVRLDVRDWNDTVLQTQSGLQIGDSVDVVMPYGGEALLELMPEATTDEGGVYGFDIECLSNCADNWSKYPFFLMHGFSSSGDTFERAVEIFDDAGYRVYADNVDKYDTSLVRGAQWMDHIEARRADGTFRGVHLVGHSMGGMDARFMAANLDPDGLIKTVTTLSTPHWGTPVADIALDLVDHDYEPEEVGEMLEAIIPDGAATDDQGMPSIQSFGLANQLYQLSTDGAAFFNTQAVDRDDVFYRSWTGMTCGYTQFGCQWDYGWEVVSLMLLPTHLVMRANDLPSDGVVDVYSGIWGEFQGVLAADHNEMSGGRFWSWPSFDDDGFFQREAYRLADWEHGWAPSSEPEAYSLNYVEDNW